MGIADELGRVLRWPLAMQMGEPSGRMGRRGQAGRSGQREKVGMREKLASKLSLLVITMKTASRRGMKNKTKREKTKKKHQ